MGTQDDEFICPQSRFAGLPDLEMEKAQKEGKLNLLAYGENVGYTIFESNDQKQLMQLGHPEYTVHRIISEIERDKEKGDVPKPENFDVNSSKTAWRSHRNLLFQQWLWFCYLLYGVHVRLTVNSLSSTCLATQRQRCVSS